MGDCSGQRVLVVLVIVLSVVTAILIGVLVWRETREEKKTELTSENIIKAYPSSFRTQTEQNLYLRKYIEGIENRTKVQNVTFSQNGTCGFSCFKGEFPARRRREATGGVLHGCCQSSVQFVFPSTKVNIFGVSRTLLQLSDARQYFAEHQCASVARCTGCTCYRENNLHTAVVLKSHISDIDDAEYVEDTETDFFYFDGCCKCINT
ncbi:uncharacterized protein LOC123539107 [Mercenaria mercenaria]|uniref:uncharacterized protein LOC123539107 n=1 Tax=Mercenaria mercenaria TaxID=6596 RepID=UPI00234F5DF7|nr:uncharacterized protein LOC123539107 [Mercenaria mercenaria]